MSSKLKKNTNAGNHAAAENSYSLDLHQPVINRSACGPGGAPTDKKVAFSSGVSPNSQRYAKRPVKGSLNLEVLQQIYDEFPSMQRPVLEIDFAISSIS